MAQAYAFLGPPPEAFVSRSETAAQCFDTNGQELFSIPCPPFTLLIRTTRASTIHTNFIL